jgi:hypothetical protein
MRIVGCRIEEIIDVEDDATPSEVDEQVREWAMDRFEYWGDIQESGTDE